MSTWSYYNQIEGTVQCYSSMIWALGWSEVSTHTDSHWTFPLVPTLSSGLAPKIIFAQNLKKHHLIKLLNSFRLSIVTSKLNSKYNNWVNKRYIMIILINYSLKLTKSILTLLSKIKGEKKVYFCFVKRVEMGYIVSIHLLEYVWYGLIALVKE